MKIRATSFADRSDLLAYNRAVISGKSPRDALSVGDNGLGASNLSTVAGTGPCCALHGRENLGKRVKVILGIRSVECDVRDVSPSGVCDLNPDACAELGLIPPVDTTVEMFFVD
jgi:hypothetical protein